MVLNYVFYKHCAPGGPGSHLCTCTGASMTVGQKTIKHTQMQSQERSLKRWPQRCASAKAHVGVPKFAWNKQCQKEGVASFKRDANRGPLVPCCMEGSSGSRLSHGIVLCMLHVGS
eukprot:3200606-Amphidinium_carterae.1